MSYGHTAHKGIFEITDWSKYAGTKFPEFRSSFEYRTYDWCQKTKAVVKWSVETVIVPYFDPIKQKKRRYGGGGGMEVIDKTGNLTKYLVEIKPESMCKPPKPGRKKTKTLLQEQATWMTNQAKWQAAEQFAKERGWKFILLTENDIFSG